MLVLVLKLIKMTQWNYYLLLIYSMSCQDKSKKNNGVKMTSNNLINHLLIFFCYVYIHKITCFFSFNYYFLPNSKRSIYQVQIHRSVSTVYPLKLKKKFLCAWNLDFHKLFTQFVLPDVVQLLIIFISNLKSW